MRAAASGATAAAAPAAPAAASSSSAAAPASVATSSGAQAAAPSAEQGAHMLAQHSLFGALAAADMHQSQAAGMPSLMAAASAPLEASTSAMPGLPPPPRPPPLEQHASFFSGAAQEAAPRAAPVLLRPTEATAPRDMHTARHGLDAALSSAIAPDLDWLMHDHSPLAAASSLASLFPPAPAPSADASAGSAAALALQPPAYLLDALHSSAHLYGPVAPDTGSGSTTSQSATAAAVSPSSDWARLLSSYVASPSPTPSSSAELPDSATLSSWLAASPRLLSSSPSTRPSGSSLDSSPTSAESVDGAASSKTPDDCHKAHDDEPKALWSWSSALRSYPIEHEAQKRRVAEQRALLGLLVDGDPMGDALVLPRQDFRRAILLNSVALGEFHGASAPRSR